MPSRKFTDSWLKTAKPEAGKPQTRWFDSDTPQLMCVVGKQARTFMAVDYTGGKSTLIKLGRYPELGLSAARGKAREFRDNPTAARTKASSETFSTEAQRWIDRYVVPRGLRSEGEIRRMLAKYINPKIGSSKIRDLKRSDIVGMLDHVEDEHGLRMADACLATVRSVFNFYQSRNDDFTSPIVKGMARRKPSEHARSRILTDDEIRTVWTGAGKAGSFGAIVKLLLLTAQRREMVAGMRDASIDDDGVWTLPQERRAKGNIGNVRLPEDALEIIRAQPRVDGCDFVFPASRLGRGKANDEDATLGPFIAFAKPKRDLDKDCGFKDWVLHDLRRTARSLMSRAGVRPDIAERVLGHVQPGVMGTYDRHRYDEEKRQALEALASLLRQVVYNEVTNKVVPLRRS